MSGPLVSVVMAVHNAAGELPRTVDSLRAQTFSDFELVAVDDGSTDATWKMLHNLRMSRIRLQLLD